MGDLVHFSFALSSRMRAFIALRDGLSCLEQARSDRHGAAWLHAACDLRTSLLGEQGRKNALPEIITIFADLQEYLQKLSEDAPLYRDTIARACQEIDRQMSRLQDGVPEVCDYLEQDALIHAYLNTQKKHDWLGHKWCMPQSITALWRDPDARILPLHQRLVPLDNAIAKLNEMLSDFVGWNKRTATAGSDHIVLERGKSYGLMVIALQEEIVAQGIIPDISSNRLAIRLRFQQWQAGEPSRECEENIPYAMMLVPIGG